jgi:hypothetical protein
VTETRVTLGGSVTHTARREKGIDVGAVAKHAKKVRPCVVLMRQKLVWAGRAHAGDSAAAHARTLVRRTTLLRVFARPGRQGFARASRVVSEKNFQTTEEGSKMRKLILGCAALTAALFSCTASAAAQTHRQRHIDRGERRELRADRREVRSDSRELRGDRRERREDGRDLRGDVRELREDRREGSTRAELRADHREIVADRHELRHDGRELRSDRRDRRGDTRDFRRDLRHARRD